MSEKSLKKDVAPAADNAPVASGASAGQPKPPLWTRDFVLIFASNFLCFIAFQSMPAVIPVYLDKLGVPSWEVGLAVSITTLTVIISRPFAGMGLDRYGRRTLYLVGLVLLMLTLGPIGLVPSVAFVFTIRFLHGIAWGVANTAATTVAADIIPRQRFGEGMGYFSLSNALALAIAPALALFLMHSVEFWQLALGACAMILFSLLFSGFISYKPIEGRGRRAAEQGTGQGSEQGSGRGSGETPAQGTAQPRFSLASLKQAFEKSALAPGLIILFSNMVYGAVNTFMALAGYAVGVENIGVFFIVYAAAVMCSRPFFGRFVDTHGYRIPVTVGLASIFVALCIIPFATSLAVFLIAGVIYGVGQGCTISALQTMAVADAPYERRGAATSTFFIFFDAGIGLGALSAGVIAGLVGYSTMFGLLALLPVVALVIYCLLARRR